MCQRIFVTAIAVAIVTSVTALPAPQVEEVEQFTPAVDQKRANGRARLERLLPSRTRSNLLRREEHDELAPSLLERQSASASPTDDDESDADLELPPGLSEKEMPFKLIGHFEDRRHGWRLGGGASVFTERENKQYSAVRFSRDCSLRVSSGASAETVVDTEVGVSYVVVFQASYQPTAADHLSSDGYMDIAGDKRRFTTTAQCTYGRRTASTGATHQWDTFRFQFVATEAKTTIALGEVGAGECVSVREVSLGPAPGESADKWKSAHMLMSALHRTGCPNIHEDTIQESYWKMWRQDEETALRHMWQLCNAVRTSTADETQEFACCGLMSPCNPETCHSVTSVDPDEDLFKFNKWLDLTGMNATQISVVDQGSADKAIDRNMDNNFDHNSCTMTDAGDKENPWWQVQLSSLQEVRAIRVTARSDSDDFATVMPFSVDVGNSRCASDVIIGRGETKEVPCVGSGDTVRIQVQRSGVKMNLCEVQLQVTGSTRGSSEVGCPLDMGSFAWHGNGDVTTGYLAGNGQYFETKQKLRRPVSVFAELRTPVPSGVNCLAVTMFGKDADHNSGYALNWGDRMQDVSKEFTFGYATSHKILSCDVPSVEKVFQAKMPSVMVVTGMLSRLKSGPAAVDVYVNDDFVKRVWTYTSANQKSSAVVHWSGEVPPGQHRVRLHLKDSNLWACPPDTGYLEAAFFEKADDSPVRADNILDGDAAGNGATGCPPNRADTDALMEKQFVLGSDTPVLLMASIARQAEGEPELSLHVDGVQMSKTSTYTDAMQWAQGYLFFTANLKAGVHNAKVYGTHNAWGCGQQKVGTMDVVSFEGLPGGRAYTIRSPASKITRTGKRTLISKKVRLSGSGLIVVTANLMSKAAGARTMELKINGDVMRRAPAFTSLFKKESHSIVFIGGLSKGDHQIQLVESEDSKPDGRLFWGENEDWGGLNILTFEGQTERLPKEVMQFHPFQETKLFADKIDTQWHKVRMDADTAGSVRFYRDGQLVSTFADYAKQEGPVRFISPCQAVQVRNVHASSSDMCATPTRTCATTLPMPLGTGGQMWRGTGDDSGKLGPGEVLESTMRFARPLKVYAQMRARPSGCLVMTLFGKTSAATDGYSLAVYDLEYRVGPGQWRQKKSDDARKMTRWHSLRIDALGDGEVRYYINDALKFVHKDPVGYVGPIRFVASCNAVQVRNVVATIETQCARDSNRMRPSWIEK